MFLLHIGRMDNQPAVGGVYKQNKGEASIPKID